MHRMPSQAEFSDELVIYGEKKVRKHLQQDL